MIQWPRNSPFSSDRQNFSGINTSVMFCETGEFSKRSHIFLTTPNSQITAETIWGLRPTSSTYHFLEGLMSVLVELISGLALEGSVTGQLWRRGPGWTRGSTSTPFSGALASRQSIKDVTVYIVWMGSKWGMLNERPILQDSWLAKWPYSGNSGNFEIWHVVCISALSVFTVFSTQACQKAYWEDDTLSWDGKRAVIPLWNHTRQLAFTDVWHIDVWTCLLDFLVYKIAYFVLSIE